MPPEHLADYIAEFRAALDRRGLVYGMFGHVDAGVLHVRPAIDMTDPAQEPLIREISDEVVGADAEVRRGALGRARQGRALRIRAGLLRPALSVPAADQGRLRPPQPAQPRQDRGPGGRRLLRIDEVPTRGAPRPHDPCHDPGDYDNALHCNGNGACYNWDPDDAMCPSWKGTRERRHSPKGRAQLMREWLRQLRPRR